MDGTFTPCQATPNCTRMDRHEGACNRTVAVRKRTHASRLRYLAGQLDQGTRPDIIAAALRDMARELE